MTALHRVKAYFGMVPADELDSYDGYGDYDDRRHVRDRHDDYDRYGSDRYASERYDRYGDRDRERWSDRHDERWSDREPEPLSRSRADDRDARDVRESREPSELRTRTPRPRDPEPELEAAEQAAAARPASRGRSWAQNTGPNHTSVRSGLSGPVRVSSGSGSSGSSSGPGSSSPAPALAPVASAGTPATAPVAAAPSGASAAPSGTSAPTAASTGSPSSSGPTAVTRGALAVDESRRPVAAAVPEPPADTPAPAEISSIQPQSYNEARVIGERYRDGIPVIMNLTEMDDASAKRLVDFAAGLAFALRGSIEKVTNRVFLLSPPNVEVSAAERRKFAENGFTSGT